MVIFMTIDISGDFSPKKITNTAFIQEVEGEASLRPRRFRIYRPGKGKGQPEGLYRGCETPKGAA
jgi:hypothetical protein